MPRASAMYPTACAGENSCIFDCCEPDGVQRESDPFSLSLGRRFGGRVICGEILRRRKKLQLERGPPLEPGVKRDQRVRVCFGKSGQVGIRPGTRSNARLCHELAPSGLDKVRLSCEDQPPIGTQLFERLPRLADSPRSAAHYAGIRLQTKEAFELSGRRQRKRPVARQTRSARAGGGYGPQRRVRSIR